MQCISVCAGDVGCAAAASSGFLFWRCGGGVNIGLGPT